VNVSNAPKQSLEWRIQQLLCRYPSGLKRAFIDARFRRESPQDIDAALECLRSAKIAACTNGLWFNYPLAKARLPRAKP